MTASRNVRQRDPFSVNPGSAILTKDVNRAVTDRLGFLLQCLFLASVLNCFRRLGLLLLLREY